MYNDDKRDGYETKTERRNKRRRAEIAEALAAGKTYRQIERDLGVSTTTISTVKRMMDGGEPWI